MRPLLLSRRNPCRRTRTPCWDPHLCFSGFREESNSQLALEQSFGYKGGWGEDLFVLASAEIDWAACRLDGIELEVAGML